MDSNIVGSMEQSERDRQCNGTILASPGNPAKCMWHTKAASLEQWSKQQEERATEFLNGQLNH